jgi:hypothetical protein
MWNAKSALAQGVHVTGVLFIKVGRFLWASSIPLTTNEAGLSGLLDGKFFSLSRRYDLAIDLMTRLVNL